MSRHPVAQDPPLHNPDPRILRVQVVHTPVGVRHPRQAASIVPDPHPRVPLVHLQVNHHDLLAQEDIDILPLEDIPDILVDHPEDPREDLPILDRDTHKVVPMEAVDLHLQINIHLTRKDHTHQVDPRVDHQVPGDHIQIATPTTRQILKLQVEDPQVHPGDLLEDIHQIQLLHLTL